MLNNRIQKLYFVVPFVIAFAIYYPAINNFFTWDDFIWLYRAKTLLNDPLQMFRTDVIYFDPLIHLSFWLDYNLAGFNYQWYHFIDIAVHGLNGYVLYLISKKYTEDNLLALIVAVIFVSTFATADAVLWSSSRVDLFATLFLLLSFYKYMDYVTNDRALSLYISIGLFLVSLMSKGTPLAAPILFLLFSVQKTKKKLYSVVPFFCISALYLCVLKYALVLEGKAFSSNGLSLNIHNSVLAIVSFVVPERIIPANMVNYLLLVVVIVLCLIWFLKYPLCSNELKQFGIVMFFVGLLPLLVIANFKLVQQGDNIADLLSSPSHRVYLASVGFSILIGIFLRYLLSKNKSFAILSLTIITFFVLFNAYEIRNRCNVWKLAGSSEKIAVEGLKKYADKIHNGNMVFLVNYQMSRGFLQPMFKAYLGLNSVEILPMVNIPLEIPDDPGIIKYVNRCNLFVQHNDKVVDMSAEMDQLLNISLQYNTCFDIEHKIELERQYKSIAMNINQAIEVTSLID